MKVHHGLKGLPRFRNAVLTIGSFDGVHLGHKSIIDQVNDLARKNRGESVLMTFHPHPRLVLDPQDRSLSLLTTLDEKVELLRKTGIDHLVIVPFTFEFSQMDPEEYLRNVLIDGFDPHTIVIGYDHRFGLNRAGDVNFLRSRQRDFGYKVVEIEEKRVSALKISSTQIRTALQQKEIIKANLLLGHAYRLTGKVVRGLRIGKTLGYPTANLSIEDPNKLIPVDGIYAVKLRIDGHWFQGMMYIGDRPTIKGQDKRTIEVNIFDFNQEIYGEDITVEIKAFIRNDAKFDDLEELKKQISDDERVVRRLFHRMDDDSTKITKCAIVILNYNGRHHLETYLPSVMRSDLSDCKVIVCDNASTDDSVSWLSEHYPDIPLIKLEKNYGFAGGYNEALKQVKARYYILLNSDVEPGKNFPQGLIDCLDADPEVAACQPKVLSWKDKTVFEYAGAAGGLMDRLGYPLCRGRMLETVEKDEGQYDEPREIFWATGAAMAIRANLFHKAGGFDAWYFAHQEEIDLCWRLKRAGFKIMAIPSSVVYHLGGGTLDYLSTRKTYLNFRNSLANILKNKPLLKAIPMIFFRLILDGAASFYFLYKGQSSHVFAVLKAHLHFYMALPSLLQSKFNYNLAIRKIRCGRSREHYGVFNHSVVWKYYIQGVRRTEDLVN
jgi:riboflavin kinase/FMN adenylyltransferase